jgi:hypothetical protein
VLFLLAVVVAVVVSTAGGGAPRPDEGDGDAVVVPADTGPDPIPDDHSAKPQEFTSEEIFNQYTADPEGFKKRMTGKPVVVLFANIRWEVEDFKKTQDPRGNFVIGIFDLLGEVKRLKIVLVFPGADKLSLFSRIEEYAKQRRRGEIITVKVAGFVRFTDPGNGRQYLTISKAKLP